jgi:hypothetical protein
MKRLRAPEWQPSGWRTRLRSYRRVAAAISVGGLPALRSSARAHLLGGGEDRGSGGSEAAPITPPNGRPRKTPVT